MNNSAGAWLNWSVHIDLMRATSSTISVKWGSNSLTHAPLLPYCANLYGEPSILGTPLINAKRWPLSNSSGHGFRFSSASFGFQSNMSSDGGAPDISR